jgi:hypothetical protein
MEIYPDHGRVEIKCLGNVEFDLEIEIKCPKVVRHADEAPCSGYLIKSARSNSTFAGHPILPG